MKTEIADSVSLGAEAATVTIVRTYKLFDNPAQRFIIEVDGYGFSAIEKEGNNYFWINCMTKTEKRLLTKRKLTKAEVRETIEAHLIAREEEG